MSAFGRTKNRGALRKTVCFSPVGDLAGGAVVVAIGVDACRHVKGRSENLAIAVLPLLLGLHQIDETFVWWGLQGHVAAEKGKDERLQKKMQLAVRITKAEADMARLPVNQQKYHNVTAQILEISRQQVLHPVVGAFLVGVQGQIERIAEASGVAIASLITGT